MRLLLLTGGSRGIGRAIIHVLARKGFVAIEFSRTAPLPFSVRTDLAAPLDAYGTIRDALARLEADSIEEILAITNAATLDPIGPVSGKSPALIVGNVNVNVTSSILFISAVLAHFQSTPCRKVMANMAAGAAHGGVFGWSLYCAAKVAMENFIRSLAIEQQAQTYPFIAVNIDPGIVDTEMHATAASAPLTDFPCADRFASRRAQRLLTAPRQAAVAIARLLLSPHLESGRSYDAREVEA